VWVFFSDERNVAHASPDSNVGAAAEALLSHVPIPKEQVRGGRGRGGDGWTLRLRTRVPDCGLPGGLKIPCAAVGAQQGV
jgi:hypothetical protein